MLQEGGGQLLTEEARPLSFAFVLPLNNQTFSNFSQRSTETLAGSIPGSGRSPGVETATHYGILAWKTPRTEESEIGVGTTGFGIFFILFGMLLYFDSVLLAFGNLLFLTGLSLIIGLRRTFSFFFQRHKLKGTSFFLGGVVIVLLRWPLLGMFLETYGFFSLFRGFFPVAFGFLGSASNIPFLSALFQRLQGTSSMV